MSDFQLTDLLKLETELGSLLELAFDGLGTQICTGCGQTCHKSIHLYMMQNECRLHFRDVYRNIKAECFCSLASCQCSMFHYIYYESRTRSTYDKNSTLLLIVPTTFCKCSVI